MIEARVTNPATPTEINFPTLRVDKQGNVYYHINVRSFIVLHIEKMASVGYAQGGFYQNSDIFYITEPFKGTVVLKNKD
jgi:hypothetical protein